eukprot:5003010-Pyramimonas_sp.AAC.1
MAYARRPMFDQCSINVRSMFDRGRASLAQNIDARLAGLALVAGSVEEYHSTYESSRLAVSEYFVRL